MIDHENTPQRQQPPVLRIKLVVVGQEEVDQLSAVDDPHVGAVAGDLACAGREAAKGDEDAPFVTATDERSEQLLHDGRVDWSRGLLALDLDDWRLEPKDVVRREDVDSAVSARGVTRAR